MSGPQGAPGESAYEIYKRVTGGLLNEAEWIASLKGEQGEKGETGTAGAVGPQGPAGRDGQSDVISTQECTTSSAIFIRMGEMSVTFIEEIPSSYDAGLRVRVTGDGGFIDAVIQTKDVPSKTLNILSDNYNGTLNARLNTSSCRVQAISPAVRAGFLFGAGKGIQKNSTNYFGPGMTWDGIGQASADIVAIPSPSGGVLSNLRVNLAGATTGGTRYEITIITSANGSDWNSSTSKLKCSIQLPARRCEQLSISETLTISPGDLIAVKVDGVGGTSSGQTLQWSVTLAPNG